MTSPCSIKVVPDGATAVMGSVAIDANEAESEVEVTPEMIEAGFAVLVSSAITDDPLEADRLVVADIYRAMARAEKH